jgi:hypothetical protein
MEAHLRAGVAVYNAGHYHAAHDAWEDHWLDLPAGEDRDFLQGLIQFTAAVHHTTEDNADGAAGLAESALEYLDGLGERYRGVDLAPVREHLAAVETAPLDAGDPPRLTHDGDALALSDLEFEATAVAAAVLAEAFGYDEATVEQGVDYARDDLGEPGRSPFVALVFDFVRDGEHRPMVVQRLGEHIDRRRQRERDVEGLF